MRFFPRCWWCPVETPEPAVAEPRPWVAGLPWVPNSGEGAAWKFSFVGLRDRSAGLWAACWLACCSW